MSPNGLPSVLLTAPGPARAVYALAMGKRAGGRVCKNTSEVPGARTDSVSCLQHQDRGTARAASYCLKQQAPRAMSCSMFAHLKQLETMCCGPVTSLLLLHLAREHVALGCRHKDDLRGMSIGAGKCWVLGGPISVTMSVKCIPLLMVAAPC